jgi:NADPH:quinone reductase-like Zn-dependent oxidoreductase
VEMVRAIGADHVIDYTKDDFTKGPERYDLIFDTVVNHSLWDERRVMNPQAISVLIGGSNDEPWLGPMSGPIKAYAISPFVSQKFSMLLADANKTADLNTLRDLMQTGKLTPVIDRTYPLNATAEAMRYLELGHARGKVVITVE